MAACQSGGLSQWRPAVSLQLGGKRKARLGAPALIRQPTNNFVQQKKPLLQRNPSPSLAFMSAQDFEHYSTVDPILWAELLLANASCSSRTRVTAGCVTRSLALMDGPCEHTLTLQIRRRPSSRCQGNGVPAFKPPAPRLVGVEPNPGPSNDHRLPAFRLGHIHSLSSPCRSGPPCAAAPAARLVGIELNPGPPKRAGKSSQIASGLASLGAALGMGGRKVPKSIRKRPKQKTKLVVGLSRAASISAPATSSVQHTTGQRTGVFSVPVECAILQVITNASSFTALQEVGLGTENAFQAATVAVSPYPAGSGATYPSCFPHTVNTLSRSFAMYRIRPGSARMYYSAVVPTTKSGNIALMVLPPDEPKVTPFSYRVASAGECSLICPAWSGKAEFDRAALNAVIGPGWRYCDLDGVVSQAQVRQSGLFNMAVSSLGTDVSTVYGTLFFSAIFEFQHLQDNDALIESHAPTAAASSVAAPALSVYTGPSEEYELVRKKLVAPPPSARG